MISKKTLKLSLKSLRDFAKKRLPDQELIDLDARDECPLEIIHDMCDPKDSAFNCFSFPKSTADSAVVPLMCIAFVRRWRASILALRRLCWPPSSAAIRSLSAPLRSRRSSGWAALRTRVCCLPTAPPNRRRAAIWELLKSTAERVMQDGRIVGYKINGLKQWISNGGIADAYTILAATPSGPTLVHRGKGRAGFKHDKPEDKHGIRLSNTAALALDNVYVDADRLIGGVEGQGLIQAQAVFGYTRLMVAAFGLGGGWAALDRAIPYSTKRIQAGAPLSEKQGYTHKLIVPHVARLEAGRASIEETARAHRRRRRQSQHRRRHRKVHGDRGRQHGRRRRHSGAWRLRLHPRVHGGEDQARRSHHHHLRRHLRDHGDDHQPRPLAAPSENARPVLSRRGEEVRSRCTLAHPEVGANIAALALHALAEVMEKCRVARLTRHQHILLRLGELIAYAECAGSLARRAALMAEGKLNEKADTAL